MAGDRLGYWDYVKAAFHWKTPLALLGSVPLNKLLLAGFAILGFGNPGFWLLGLGYEAAYLLFLSGSPRFQNLVKGLRLVEAKQTWGEKEQDMLNRLDKNGQQRYFNLLERCRKIMQAEQGFEGTADLVRLKLEGLNQLLLIYVKLLGLQGRINETLAKTRQADLEADIKSLTAKLEREPESSPVHRALRGTLEIQQARLENLTKSRENLKFTETELDRIEKQVSLIAEEVAISKNPEQLSLSLDGVVKSIQGTTKWMADNSELFEAMDVPSAPVDLIRGASPRGVAQKQ